MTTTKNDEITWTTARPEDNASFVAFVDACFGRPAGASLRRDFPVALGAANASHQFLGTIDGNPVCAATAVVRTWLTSEGPVRAACVGCFSTDPAQRGRGLSGRLQEWILERLREEGVQWAALWTDRPELYRRRGFAPAGRERHLDLSSVRWPALGRGIRVRRAEGRDAARMLELHLGRTWRVERSLEDMAAHLDPATSEVWVAEGRGDVEAWIGLGKGRDFAGYVADFAGDGDLLAALLGFARLRGARFVLVPEGDEERIPGASALPTTDAALVRVLADGPDPTSCHWAVGGFDSA